MAELLPQLLVLAGIALVIAEALAPGAHFIVLGVALLVAGMAGVLIGGPLASAAALAAMVLVVGLATFYAYREFDLYGGKGQDQTSDSDSLKGSVGRVTRRVTETDGEVKIDDGGFNPHYQARSMSGEIAEGEKVLVVDPGGGNVLTVEALSDIDSDGLDRELAAARESAESDGGTPAGPEVETETEPGSG